MKILTWNVNGLRATLKKDFAKKMYAEDPDLICLQEIKAESDQVRGPVLEGYSEHWHSSNTRKGYSGTMILAKNEPLAVRRGLPGQAAENEGRLICAELDAAFLVNVYVPNSQDKLKRIDVRLEWDRTLLAYLRDLERSKPVVLCGDLNVAHKEIDLAHPDRNRGKSGFSDEERQGFSDLLEAGYLDAFRIFEKGPDHYTFWRFNKGTREKNLGWRIDYFLVSKALESSINRCYHLADVMGSDHCPVVLELSL